MQLCKLAALKFAFSDPHSASALIGDQN